MLIQANQYAMHRLPSELTLRRFKITSFLVFFVWFCVPVVLGLLFLGFYTAQHHWLAWAAGVAGFGILCMIICFFLSGRVKCPLCMMPPLQNRRCSRHRTSETWLGSYKLKVAQSILFKGSFRCPYCGEPTAMEVRQRSGR